MGVRKYEGPCLKHESFVRSYNNAYDRAHPDKAKARVHKRRAREIGAEGQYTKADWDEIVHRQDGRCAACGTQERLTVDHILPLSRGGSNWPTNLQGLCLSCNSRKGTLTMDEFMEAA